MKNERGASAIIWILAIFLVIFIIVFSVQYLFQQVEKEKGEDIITEMLQVQAKAKVVLEKYHINTENGLKGEKMEDTSLENIFGITQINTYYKWNIDTLKEVGLQEPKLKTNEFYLVNYDSGEVVYSLGYKKEDGNVYYKLSEIKTTKY